MRKNCETCKYDDVEYSYKTHCSGCYNMDDDPTKWEPAEHYEPDTNADRIRAMSDEELAKFLADRFAKEHCHRLYAEGSMLTATQIEAISYTWYCTWIQWLKQQTEVTDNA